LMTPLGWTTGNMMYETANGNPAVGSIQELTFMVLFTMREDAKFREQMLHAVAAATEDGDSTQKAMKEYMDAQFPYLKQQAEADQARMKEVMEKELYRTAFKVRRVK